MNCDDWNFRTVSFSCRAALSDGLRAIYLKPDFAKVCHPHFLLPLSFPSFPSPSSSPTSNPPFFHPSLPPSSLLPPSFLPPPSSLSLPLSLLSSPLYFLLTLQGHVCYIQALHACEETTRAQKAYENYLLRFSDPRERELLWRVGNCL